MRRCLLRLIPMAVLLLMEACGGGGGGSQPPAVVPPTTYTVSFAAGTGGTLTGATSQTITSGGSTTPVTAVPNPGYTFTNWTGTGLATATANPLSISGVTQTLSVTANFTVKPSASVQVLMNGDFEQASPLIWQGDTGIISTNQDATYAAHAGTHFAWIGGYGTATSDEITQDVYLPTDATAASVSFWLNIITQETVNTANDVFTLRALDTSGNSLGTLFGKSNVDASGYTLYSVDLLPLKGQVIRLAFKSIENASLATSFLLDDVSLSVASSNLKPVISSFTPTSGVGGETTIQVTGNNFFGLTSLVVGGVGTPYTLTDGTRLSFVIPAAVPYGPQSLSLTNAFGTGSSGSSLTIAYGTPVVTTVNPPQGPVGTPVILSGSYLGYPGSTITLNGQTVPIATQSNSQLSFNVPVGATSGNLVLQTPGGSVTRTFTVTTDSQTLDLHPHLIQVTQSTQSADGSVPLVAGKDALLRVFVLANQVNTAKPSVQVTLLNGSTPVAGYPKTIPAPGASVPLAVDQSALTASWNLVIPGTDLTTPSAGTYTVQVFVDPTGAIGEADKTNNSASLVLTGTTVPIFKTKIFPVVLASGTGEISESNKASWVAQLAKMYPVASVDVQVGAAFTGSVSSVDSDGTGWSTLLSDLATKHQADGASDRYYFGALKVGYASGVAGLGYAPSLPSASYAYRTALGWDKSSGYADGGLYYSVFAHETGHNMGRRHSPCGTVASPDPAYPYPGGLIGVWGYDTATAMLKDPATYKDIMGYCTPDWVSDYVYKGILAFRGATAGFLIQGSEEAPLVLGTEPRECLLARGIVHKDGSVTLLPAFRTKALPTPPPPSGEFRLTCLDAQGQVRHTTYLETMETGCGPVGERHFLVALPLVSSLMDAVVAFQVHHEGRLVAEARSLSSGSEVGRPEIRRIDSEKAQVSWVSSVHLAALVRDLESGEVLAILKGGSEPFPTRGSRFEVTLSDGVASRTHRVELP